jgi:hypothetical protein
MMIIIIKIIITKQKLSRDTMLLFKVRLHFSPSIKDFSKTPRSLISSKKCVYIFTCLNTNTSSMHIFEKLPWQHPSEKKAVYCRAKRDYSIFFVDGYVAWNALSGSKCGLT